MTKRYEEREVPASIESYEVGANCDKCGCDIKHAISQKYNEREFTLEFMTGYCYGVDGSSMSGWELEDLCDNCCQDLRALLEKSGFQTKDKERDW